MPHFVRPLAAPPESPLESQSTEAISDRDLVTVVSGLPRSGTSLMMQMLVAGGLSPLTDGVRAADENNPRGYFEHERIKRLAEENDWLGEARGKVLKIVAPLIPSLPSAERYRVVFMERDLDEVLSSQWAMLNRLEREGGKLDTARMEQLLQQQVQRAVRLCRAHQIPLLVVAHREALNEPATVVARLAWFLERDLDQKAMIQVVDRSLHREQRGSL